MKMPWLLSRVGFSGGAPARTQNTLRFCRPSLWVGGEPFLPESFLPEASGAARPRGYRDGVLGAGRVAAWVTRLCRLTLGPWEGVSHLQRELRATESLSW